MSQAPMVGREDVIRQLRPGRVGDLHPAQRGVGQGDRRGRCGGRVRAGLRIGHRAQCDRQHDEHEQCQQRPHRPAPPAGGVIQRRHLRRTARGCHRRVSKNSNSHARNSGSRRGNRIHSEYDRIRSTTTAFTVRPAPEQSVPCVLVAVVGVLPIASARSDRAGPSPCPARSGSARRA